MSEPLVVAVSVVSRRLRRPLHRPIGFSLSAGECLALRGVNGVGKSTLLSVLLGTSRDYSGKVTRSYARPGIAPQDAGFLWRLTLDEALWITGANRSCFSALHAEYASTVSLSSGEPLQYLSFGQLQLVKLLLCAAREPDFAVVDEPFAGIDNVLLHQAKAIVEHIQASSAIVLVDHEGQYDAQAEMTLEPAE